MRKGPRDGCSESSNLLLIIREFWKKQKQRIQRADAVAQQAKPLTEMLTHHNEVPGLESQFCIQSTHLPANVYSGRQEVIAQALSMWDVQMQLLAPGLDLPQPQLLQVLEREQQLKHTFSLFDFQLNKNIHTFLKKQICFKSMC